MLRPQERALLLERVEEHYGSKRRPVVSRREGRAMTKAARLELARDAVVAPGEGRQVATPAADLRMVGVAALFVLDNGPYAVDLGVLGDEVTAA
jgi:hypothetical protein